MIHTARMNIQEDFAADWTSINVNDLDIEMPGVVLKIDM